MKIRKAVITAAGSAQRNLPLQTIIDRDGAEKSVLQILLGQALASNVEEVCIITWPGDEVRYAQAIGKFTGHVTFQPQPQPLGYGHAVYCAREFVADESFLHLVGDHLYVGSNGESCAQRLLEFAEAESCAVSLVQPTRENLLPNFGAVSGRRLAGRADTYRVDTVIEKPTPTEAEQRLVVSGLRAGHYLCFFGMHVLTPTVMDLLGRRIEAGEGRVTLSAALADLAGREQYLALEESGRRYDLGARYGLLTAQVAVALSGADRSEVLSSLLELLADRTMRNGAGRG